MLATTSQATAPWSGGWMAGQAWSERGEKASNVIQNCQPLRSSTSNNLTVF